MTKKILFAAAVLTTFSFATDLYTDTYMSRSGVVKGHMETGIPNAFNVNRLYDLKSRRHIAVYFKEGIMTDMSRSKLDELLEYANASGKRYYITVIGHTAGFTNESHTIELDPWAQFWQSLGTKKISKEELAETVNVRIQAVHDYLTGHNVPMRRIYNENRMDRDPLNTEATTEGRALNTRVDVAVYY